MKTLIIAMLTGTFAVLTNPLFSAPTSDSTSSPPASTANQVEVVGSDYAFRIPSELRAGVTTFHFRNDGKARHELAILRLKPGATVNELVAREKRSASTADLLDGVVGVLFADPGKRSTSGLTANLVPGKYAVQCSLRDKPAAPQHFELGMYSTISVRGPASSSRFPTKADTIIATEYAFRYPRTLSPGRHTSRPRNEGTVAHELNIALLKKGVTLDEFMKVRIANGNARALVDEGLGVLSTLGREAPLGRLTQIFCRGATTDHVHFHER